MEGHGNCNLLMRIFITQFCASQKMKQKALEEERLGLVTFKPLGCVV